MNAGDDAADVTWVEYREDMTLFANHKHFLALAHQAIVNPDSYTPPMIGQNR